MFSDQEKIFLRLVEEAGGKKAALWVRSLKRNYEDALNDLEDRDRSALHYRHLLRSREEHRATRRALYEIQRLLKQKPVPVKDINQLIEENLKTHPVAPADPPPSPGESPQSHTD